MVMNREEYKRLTIEEIEEQFPGYLDEFMEFRSVHIMSHELNLDLKQAAALKFRVTLSRSENFLSAVRSIIYSRDTAILKHSFDQIRKDLSSDKPDLTL
jgi:hypothetical protein